MRAAYSLIIGFLFAVMALAALPCHAQGGGNAPLRGNVEVNLDVLDHYAPAPRQPAPAPVPQPPAPVRSTPYFSDFKDGEIKPQNPQSKAQASQPLQKPPVKKKASAKKKKSSAPLKAAGKASSGKEKAAQAKSAPVPGVKPLLAQASPAPRPAAKPDRVAAALALQPKSPPSKTQNTKTPNVKAKTSPPEKPTRFEDTLTPLNSVDEVLSVLESQSAAPPPAAPSKPKGEKAGIELPDLDLAMLPPAPALKQAQVKPVSGQNLMTPMAGGVLATDGRVTLVYEPMATDLTDSMLLALQKHLGAAASVEIAAYASGGHGAQDFLQPINDEEDQAEARRVSLMRGLVIRDFMVSLGLPPEKIVFRPLGKQAQTPPLDRVDIVYSAP